MHPVFFKIFSTKLVLKDDKELKRLEQVFSNAQYHSWSCKQDLLVTKQSCVTSTCMSNTMLSKAEQNTKQSFIIAKHCIICKIKNKLKSVRQLIDTKQSFVTAYNKKQNKNLILKHAFVQQNRRLETFLQKQNKKRNHLSKKICRIVKRYAPARTPFWRSAVHSHYKITRPLLNCSRSTVTQVSVFCNLPVYPDLSNSQVVYSRNRIRKQIIPTFKVFLNPQVERSISKFSELLLSNKS